MSNREPASFGWQSARTAKVFYVIFVEEEIVTLHNLAALDDEEDGTVGCISWSRIPPPHTIHSLKRAICKAEQITEPGAYEIYKTFVDVEPLDETQKLGLLSGQYPGVDPNEPVVLVKTSSETNDTSSRIPSLNLLSPSAFDPSITPTGTTTRKLINGREIRASIHEFAGHTGRVTAVAFSSDGSLIASASEDKTIRIFDVALATLISTLQGHADSVISVAFSSDGTRIASGASGGTACIWDTASGACLRSLSDNYAISCLAFSPDGSRLASSCINSELQSWDTETWRLLSSARPWLSRYTNTSCGKISPNGSRFAAASGDNHLQVWDVATITCTTTLSGHTSAVHSVAWSHDGLLLASASADGTVRIWDSGSGCTLVTLQDPSNVVRSVAFSLDGSRVASAGGMFSVWDIASGAALSSVILQGHTSAVNCTVFSPDLSILASASSDRTVRLWRIAL